MRTFKKNGYTLIELLIVSVITIVILMGVVSSFFSTIIGNDRVSYGMLLKQEGDHALSSVLSSIRNAQSIEYPDCSIEQSELKLIDSAGIEVTYSLISDNITVTHEGQESFLTSSDVKASALSFSCTDENAHGGKRITISFLLENADASAKPREMVSQVFKGTASLRIY